MNRIPTRRAVLTLLVGGAVAIGAAGCSTAPAGDGGGSGSTTISTINLYSADSPAGKWLTAQSKAFEKANPGITVTNDFVAQTDLPTDFGKAVLSGTEPEIVMMNRVGPATQWQSQGATVPVTDYLKQWGLSDAFSPNALKEWTFDGKTEAFPLEGYNWPMWFNMDLLKQAGITAPPTTVDEIVADAKALRAKGIQPWVVGAADYPAAGVFTLIGIAAVGEQRMESLFESGDWKSADGQKVIDLITQLRNDGLFSDDSAGLKYPDQVARFGAGKAAMLFDGSWGYGNAATSFPKIDVRLGGFPVESDSGLTKPVAFSGQSTGVWITKNGQKKIGAVEKFVKALYQPKSIGAFVQIGYIDPMAAGKADYDSSKLPPLNEQSQTELPKVAVEATPTYNALSPVVQSAFFRASAKAFVKGTSTADLTSALEQAWQAK